MDYISVPIAVLGAAIGGLVGWVWALWRAHFNHERNVAENYVKKSELAEAINALRIANKNLVKIAVAIASRLSIPTAIDNDD